MAFQRRNPLCDDQEARWRVMFGKQVAPSNYSMRWAKERGENEAEEETVASVPQRTVEVLLEVILYPEGHEDELKFCTFGVSCGRAGFLT